MLMFVFGVSGLALLVACCALTVAMQTYKLVLRFDRAMDRHITSLAEATGMVKVPRPPCEHRPVTTSAGPFCEKCGEEL